MDFTTSQYTQLIVGLTAVIIMFVLAYASPEKRVIQFLVMMIPFQPVVSKYGTLNTGLALLVMSAFLLNRRVTRMPLLSIVMLALVVYLISTSQALKPTYKDHVFYLVSISANVSIFYIIFNYIIRTERIMDVINMLIWTNVLVVIYSVIQMKVGYGSASIMGIEDLTLTQNRADARLAGPFNAVGITAEYMVIQIFLILYKYFHEDSKRIRFLLLGILAGNMGVMVGTGNRGGFVVMILAAVIFFFMFRRTFGTLRMVKLGSVGVMIFTVAAVIMIAFTEFNVLFERLSETEIDQEGVPDSRSVIWPLAVERIGEEPFVGHGPRIRLIDEFARRIKGHVFMPYPHSLYLFVLYTIGAAGLLVLAVAFLALLSLFLSGMRNRHTDIFVRGTPKLALLVLTIIAIDQIKVSMMRFNLSDYQQYIAAVLGMFVGATYVARFRKNQEGYQEPPVRSKPVLVSDKVK